MGCCTPKQREPRRLHPCWSPRWGGRGTLAGKGVAWGGGILGGGAISVRSTRMEGGRTDEGGAAWGWCWTPADDRQEEGLGGGTLSLRGWGCRVRAGRRAGVPGLHLSTGILGSGPYQPSSNKPLWASRERREEPCHINYIFSSLCLSPAAIRHLSPPPARLAEGFRRTAGQKGKRGQCKGRWWGLGGGRAPGGLGPALGGSSNSYMY